MIKAVEEEQRALSARGFCFRAKDKRFALMKNGVRSRLSKGTPRFTSAGFCFHAKVDKLRFHGKRSAVKVVEGESRALPARWFCFHAKVDKIRFDGKRSTIKVGEGESVLYRHGDFGYHVEAERFSLTGRRNTIKAVEGHPCA